jgi:hypothetical protein
MNRRTWSLVNRRITVLVVVLVVAVSWTLGVVDRESI